MRALARDAGTIDTGLRELQRTAGDGRRFIGKTADQLRKMVDDHLHNFVGHVEESFHKAEAALRKYATALADAQSDADRALAAGKGLDDDDPERQRHTDSVNDAKTALETAASTLATELSAAGELMVQPVSDCDLFWEAFKWLTIIISVIAVFTGGVLGILAWAMNAVVLIKTIVDFSEGKAGGLELGLAFLGVLFPTTKALNVGALVKGLGGALKAGAGGIAGSGKNLANQINHIATAGGLPKIVVAPVVISVRAGNAVKGGWNGAGRAFTNDWVRITGQANGSWGKFGAYATVNIQRVGRLVVATFLPLNAAELGVLGFGGAARLAFGSRVLGIDYPHLEALMANSGRTQAALHGGVRTGNLGSGVLVSHAPIGTSGLHGAEFPGMPTIHLPATDFSGPGGRLAPDVPRAPGVGIPTGPGGAHGAGVPGGLNLPPAAGMHQGIPPGEKALFIPPPTGKLHPSGLSLPDAHGSATLTVQRLDFTFASDAHGSASLTVQQMDFAFGHVRLDNNLLLSAHTVIDLLKDAHGSSPLSHLTHEPLGAHVPETTFTSGAEHGIGTGHAMARGAVGHAEGLDDMSFPELYALSVGDVSVTAIHEGGATLRIGDAAPRVMTGESLAFTAPVNKGVDAPAVQHLPGAAQLPGALDGHGAPAVPRGEGAAGTGRGVSLNGAGTLDHAPVKAPVPQGLLNGARNAAGIPAPSLPALSAHDMAMNLLDPKGGAPRAATGSSADTAGPAGVSARPTLDTAGEGGGADSLRGALDLIAHPGGPAKAERAVPLPQPAAKPGPAAPAAHPEQDPSGAAATGPAAHPAGARPGATTAPPVSRFGGIPPATVLNQRIRARHDLIVGGSTGPEAGAKFNAWASYEGALSHLAKAEREAADLTPRPGAAAGRPEPTSAAVAALDELGARRAEVAEAEARLDQLGIDPQRTQREIRVITGQLAGEHGFLGGGPRPRPEPAAATPEVNRTPMAEPAARAGDDAKPQGPSRSAFDLSTPGSAARARARDDVITGGTPHWQAQARREAWMRYEAALAGLADAGDRAGRVLGDAHGAGSSGLPAGARAARDAVDVHRAAVAAAESRLAELDIDPHVMRQDLIAAQQQVGTELFHRGEHSGAVGGSPGALTEAHGGAAPDGTSATGLRQPTAEDLTWQDVSELKPAGRGGIQVNGAFRELRGDGPDGLNSNAYLEWMKQSTAESRDIGFVVNTIVRYTEIQDDAGRAKLQKFLDVITPGSREFKGKFGVVIGVNGNPEEMAKVNEIIEGATRDLEFKYPLALVGMGLTCRGENFPHGTARNITMTSPASRFMVRSMMFSPERPGHMYFAFMDFDTYPRLIFDGRHIFAHLNTELNLEVGALRPLAISGGYRLPEQGQPGAGIDHLIADTENRPGPGRATVLDIDPFKAAVSADMRARDRQAALHPLLPYSPEPNLYVDAAATLVDKADDIMRDGEWHPVRFGKKRSEFKGLAETLNSFNAWELHRTLPLPDPEARIFPTDTAEVKFNDQKSEDQVFVKRRLTEREVEAIAERRYSKQLDGAARQPPDAKLDDITESLTRNELGDIMKVHTERILAAENFRLPDRGTPFLTSFEGAAVPTDLSRILEAYVRKSKPDSRPKPLQNHDDLNMPRRGLFGRGSFDVPNTRPANLSAGKGVTWAAHRNSVLDAIPANAMAKDPFVPVHRNSGMPQASPRDIMRSLRQMRLRPQNTFGLNVSASIPGAGELALRAGIPERDKGFAALSLALGAEDVRLVRNLDFVVADTARRRTETPWKTEWSWETERTSLFHAMKNTTTGGPGGRLDPRNVLDHVVQGLSGRKGKGAKSILTEMNPATNWKDLFAALATGRIRQDSDFRAGAADTLALKLFANALGSRIRLLDAGGRLLLDVPVTTPGHMDEDTSLDFIWQREQDGENHHWVLGDSAHRSDDHGAPRPDTPMPDTPMPDTSRPGKRGPDHLDNNPRAFKLPFRGRPGTSQGGLT
ncbi:hypothetical protein OG422_29210 [Streptomyces sp. NBC_01525]|uniref:hypothetical protein n=1 Tax=Streptomyces sp. NBC_01525 TaxID=2903893 RepID=UPI00386A1B14